MGAVDIVIDGIAFVFGGLHGIGRGALLGEVNNRLGFDSAARSFAQLMIFVGEIDIAVRRWSCR